MPTPLSNLRRRPPHRIVRAAAALLAALAPAASASPQPPVSAEMVSDTLSPPAGLHLPPPRAPQLVLQPVARRSSALSASDTTTSSADLRIHIRGQGGFDGAWRRSSSCAASGAGCSPGRAPVLGQNMDLAVHLQGTIWDRLVLDVDYDGRRQLGSSNRVRLRYQGGARGVTGLQLGDVTLAVPEIAAFRGLPREYFGARGEFRLGPLDVQALVARQQGELATREVRRRLDGAGSAVLREIALDDGEFDGGRFLFLLDPARIAGYPHVDVLDLQADAVAPEVRPAGSVRLYRYVPGYGAPDGTTVHARAVPEDPDEPSVRGPFRLLEPGTDYQLHPSGLWVMLRTSLRTGEALAVAYETAAGGEVGSASDPGAGLRLLRQSGADHRPGTVTWRHSMRHVYRVGGDGVETADAELAITLGEVEGGDRHRIDPATSESVSFLDLFGLDRRAPGGRLDHGRLVPADDVFPGSAAAGTFLFFPTLEPFRAPPPGPGRTEEDALRILGDAANERVYAEPDPVRRREAVRFRLAVRYEETGSAVTGTVALGEIGMRPGSERVYLGERRLQRDVDYAVMYEIGQIRLVDPERLLASDPGAELRVLYERSPMFGMAPRTVYGATASLPIRDAGEIHLLGFLQREAPLAPRPVIGAEPRSTMMAGAGGRVALHAPWADRIVDRLARAGGDAPRAATTVHLRGSVASTAPLGGPAREGYLDDFGSRSALAIPMTRHGWRWGSAAARAEGAEGVLPERLEVANAAALVWQHEYLTAAGAERGAVSVREIDRGLPGWGDLRDDVLRIAFDPRDAPLAWRSLTAVLSTEGTDLRTGSAIELYVHAEREAALVLDLGTVSEDGFVFDSLGSTSGVDAGGRPWGLGVLDREWDPAAEVWSESHDRRGMWTAPCEAEPGRIYPPGDPRAVCTRGNGIQDSEDLRGTGDLETDERVFRYVLPLDSRSDRYLARDTAETGTSYRLYRIPLRDGIPVDATSDEWRRIRNLRITVTGGEPQTVRIARMRLSRASWERRGEGIFPGPAGSTSEPGPAGARIDIAHIDRRTRPGEYVSPPGVVEAPEDGARRIGEESLLDQALSLTYRDLPPGQRGEVYRAHGGTPYDLLRYRELRMWAVARSGAAPGDGEALVIGAGSGGDSRYLYRHRFARTGPPSGPGGWEEIVIGVDEWVGLRARAENEGSGEPGGATLWSEDGRYGLHLAPGEQPPSLAAVRDLSVSVVNGGSHPASGEVWLNDLRAVHAAEGTGLRGELEVGVDAGPLFRMEGRIQAQGGDFAPPGSTPGRSDRASGSIHARVGLGELLPAAARIDAPLVVSHSSDRDRPHYLSGSDMAAALLERGVREPGHTRTRAALTLGRSAVSGDRSPLDPLYLEAGFERHGRSDAWAASADRSWTAAIGYRARPAGRHLDLGIDADSRTARLLERLFGTPGAVRWNLTRIDLRTGVADRRSRTDRFSTRFRDAERVTADSIDARHLRAHLIAEAMPVPALSATVEVRTRRDLHGSDDLPGELSDALRGERLRLLGADLGRESDRTAQARLRWRPRWAAWIDNELDAGFSYGLDQSTAYARLGAEGAELRRSVQGGRSAGGSATIDLSGLAAALGAALPILEWTGPIALRRRRTADVRHHRMTGAAPAAWSIWTRGPGAGRVPGILQRRDEWSIRLPVRMPGGLDVSVSAAGRDFSQTAVLQDRRSREREWPAVAVRWTEMPVPDALSSVVRGGSLLTGFDFRRTLHEDVSAAHQRIGASTGFPISLRVDWPGGIVSSYRGEWRGGTTGYAGAWTRRVSADHTVSLSGTIAAPRSVRSHLPGPVTMMARASHGDRRECRVESRPAPCAADSVFGSYRTRSAAFRIDSRGDGGSVGVQLEYSGRGERIGERRSSRQLLLTVFGTFDLRMRAVR